MKTTDQETETILLTQEEYDRMVETCNNPPAPTPALIAAMKRHKEIFVDETKTSEGS